MDNVAYAKAYNTEHQSQLLLNTSAMLSESRFDIKVITRGILNFNMGLLRGSLFGGYSLFTFPTAEPIDENDVQVMVVTDIHYALAI